MALDRRQHRALLVALLVAVACGGTPAGPPASRASRPQARPAWPAAGECLPLERSTDPCIKQTITDVAAIRELILERLRSPEAPELPDAGAQRIADQPVAQWTVNTYRFYATTGADGEQVELTALENLGGSMLAGFICVLARSPDGWAVLELSSFAEAAPQPT